MTVSVVSVDADRKRVNQTVSIVPDCMDVIMEGGGGGAVGVDGGDCVIGRPASAFRSDIDGYADFAGEVAAGVASSTVLAGRH